MSPDFFILHQPPSQQQLARHDLTRLPSVSIAFRWEIPLLLAWVTLDELLRNFGYTLPQWLHC
jgi:hypothetical protein